MTNAQAQAYAVVALREMGITDLRTLQQLDHTMYRLFDEYSETAIERKATRILQNAD